MARYELGTNVPVVVRYLDPTDVSSPILYGELLPPISMRGVNAVGIDLVITAFDKKGEPDLFLNVYVDGSNDRAVWRGLPFTGSTVVISQSALGAYNGSLSDIGTRYIRIWCIVVNTALPVAPPPFDSYFLIDLAARTFVAE